MYAIARINSFDESRLAAAAPRVRSFEKLHAAQPGYRGSLVIDLNDGRRLLVNLWESEQHAFAALSVVGDDVEQVLMPLMSSPSQLLGAGPVVSTDLIHPAP